MAGGQSALFGLPAYASGAIEWVTGESGSNDVHDSYRLVLLLSFQSVLGIARRPLPRPDTPSVLLSSG